MAPPLVWLMLPGLAFSLQPVITVVSVLIATLGIEFIGPCGNPGLESLSVRDRWCRLLREHQRGRLGSILHQRALPSLCRFVCHPCLHGSLLSFDAVWIVLAS